ncbi:helix-turn-helix domain-containing protein [Noviherbaspirillum pedocola]|uniref:Helix-turn-helix domain-containing protein n=1 Tax=Noviherbaspirillum pedocola TaxID=2801341 RepID=A0A934SUU1_9BURK|nr:helix-turn-helix domain-containing protein [Noviherbaspirillum pedocola]MBK4733217.1 helix-turn-helix domain-containing protein [Noviherbaspirillum pedocola]
MTDNASVPVYKLYGEHQQWATPDMIHCETIAARSKLHNWEIKPHQHHGLFQILYLREGNARLRIEERDHPMAAGQLLLVPQMCVHGFQFAPNAQGHVITLAYPLVRRAAGAAGEALLTLRSPYLHLLAADDASAWLRGHFAALDREYRGNALHREIVLESLLGAALAWLARHAIPVAPSATHDSRGMRHFAAFCTMIEAEYASHHPISDYARRLGITAAHLNALCRQASGQSALDLIHERMLLEAKRQLVYTSMTVSTVSYSLGFADPAYFTRFFKQRIGMSPKQFRNGAQQAFGARTG